MVTFDDPYCPICGKPLPDWNATSTDASSSYCACTCNASYNDVNYASYPVTNTTIEIPEPLPKKREKRRSRMSRIERVAKYGK